MAGTVLVETLPPELQAQIAAGEVVERPASIVKELVENALDAGARRIDIEIGNGGLDLIRVRDDGHGMADDDAMRAFGRHATSKLRQLQDLDAIATHGFRGEALPSVAAAGAVRLVTRQVAATSGVAVEASGARVHAAGPSGAPPGTTVEVRELFAATPARRKFMRTAATEAAHVIEVVTHTAVVRPDVAFRVVRDGREVLAFPAVDLLRARLVQILGRARAEGLVEFDTSIDGIGVQGLLGVPRETLATARMVWTYVRLGASGAARWVRDRMLLRAVQDGYATLLMHGRHPLAIVIVTAPRGEVDVNVHPQKLEVRFQRSQVVYRAVVAAVRGRVESALKATPSTDGVEGDSTYALARAPGRVPVAGPAPGMSSQRPDTTEELGLVRDAPSIPRDAQSNLWRPAPEGFGNLRFVGQIFDGYLLCEGAGRVVLIDQHAAHERVQFERLRREHAAGRVVRDALLVAELVALAPRQVAALDDHRDALGAAGIEGEAFGDDGFLVRTAPQLLRGYDIGAIVRTLASELTEQGASRAVWDAQESVLATIACHSAVRVGQRLDDARVRALLVAMDSVDVNAHCPHGRPVTVDLGRTQIESLFRR